MIKYILMSDIYISDFETTYLDILSNYTFSLGFRFKIEHYCWEKLDTHEKYYISETKSITIQWNNNIVHPFIHNFIFTPILCDKKETLYKNIPDFFDWKLYLLINPDVGYYCFTEKEAKDQYDKYGFYENRKLDFRNLPSDFDAEIYAGLNPDVAFVCHTELELKVQYENYGYHENRMYKFKNVPSNFDWELYLHYQPDLIPHCRNKFEAMKHYEFFGFKENRQYTYKYVPDDFDWKLYLFLHPDIGHVIKNERQAKLQYEEYGHKERRQFKFNNVPEDFDYKQYQEFNSDVQRIYPGEFETKRHYELIGHKEGRHYKTYLDPEDFNWELYAEFNPDIKNMVTNEKLAKFHFETAGRWMGRYYYFNFLNIPSNFKASKYLELNPDLGRLFTTERQLKLHYELTGCYQNRLFSKNCKPPFFHENKIFNKYFALFHKFVFSLSVPSHFLIYQKEKTILTEKKYTLIIHLHCYNLNEFNHFYGEIISKLSDHLIIITFCNGDELYDLDAIYLKIPNRGMDVGAKFIVYNFLNKNKINYKYILFLHSKNHDTMRSYYFDPLVNNLNSIVNECETEEIGLYCPPLIHFGDYYHLIFNHDIVDYKEKIPRWNFGNEIYQKDLDSYFELNPNNFLFLEGNCFICKKNIVDLLYKDPLIYYALNTRETPDLIWIKSHYKDRKLQNIGNSLNDVYAFYKNDHEIFPNNLGWGAGHGGHADNMLEHNLERIVLKIVEKCNESIKILPCISKKDDSSYLENLELCNKYLNTYLKTNHF